MDDELNVSFPFVEIAFHDGDLYTIWGPCTGIGKDSCDCPQCQHAQKIEDSGLDWDVEYRKAHQR